jgi:hypothetical protein
MGGVLFIGEACYMYRPDIARRRTRPYFSNARSIRNAPDRARLRQAGPLMAIEGPVPREALMLIEPPDTLANRAFGKAAAAEADASSHGDAA